jgi:7-carboxy-7-deazaguanine synthase
MQNMIWLTKDIMLAKSQETSQWASLSIENILALVLERGYQAKHIVITGGEPSMYDLKPL